MTGGNHHTADGPLRLDRERNGGRGRRSRGQHDLESVAGQHLGSAFTKLVRQKAPVVADDYLLLGAGDGIRGPVISGRLSDAFEVRKSKALGDDCSPTVGADFDG